MQRVLVSAPAKVNLALRVGGPRPDGFHPLDTVFEAIDIFDDVEVRPAPELTVSISGLGEDLPTDESNLAIRAGRALQSRVREEGLDCPAGANIRITKRIPVAGGMAGGSADAAATLVALNELWGLGLSAEELRAIGGELGSDVPFALMGGLAHGVGRGEELAPLRAGAMHAWVLLTREHGLSTPAVFRQFDAMYPGAGEPADTAELRAALAGPAIDTVAALLANDLQPPACALRPEIGAEIELIEAAGRAVVLSGSGPTIAVLTSPEQAEELAAQMRADFPYDVHIAYGPTAGAHVRMAE
ncbi:4-(cytidine 5'-diphospho)-2-C-methyl-D-erythritol kinase [Trueperella bernardiae]|uniref:4-(cytidine 5'-diphospho)-2-C-methyl-D-erythritol kinase n=1 Tax=Trueperella bernardiae TaxID=59561 RepID=UPI0015E09926|nr:4-(cytidine 5'-diphospho)-2-C-methyl-D-erythritol kinase [Trueperella bernardiae]